MNVEAEHCMLYTNYNAKACPFHFKEKGKISKMQYYLEETNNGSSM